LLRFGLEAEVGEAVDQHAAVPDAAVGDEEDVAALLPQKVEGLHASPDPLRPHPLNLPLLTITPSKSKKKLRYLPASAPRLPTFTDISKINSMLSAKKGK
jgi:hypothetical protein